MNGATTTTTAKSITRNGFCGYAAAHRHVALRVLRACYARRRAAVCAALGLTAREFSARAKRAVEALVGFPGTHADRAQAYSYVAHCLAASVKPTPVIQVVAPKPANDNAAPASGCPACWSVTLINRDEGFVYSAGVVGSYAEACAAASGMAAAAAGWRVHGPAPACHEAHRLEAMAAMAVARAN